MGKLSRTKGHAFERHIATSLRPIYPDARRGLSQARAGHETSDVEGTPFRIECKHGKRPNLFAALRQAERDGAAARDTRPVLICARQHQGKDVALIRLDDFLELLASVGRSECAAARAKPDSLAFGVEQVVSLKPEPEPSRQLELLASER